MRTINRFFIWSKKTFQKQGIVGKVVLVCLSLLIVCCLCSIPVAILSPKPSTTSTFEVAVKSLSIRTETAIETISPTNTLEPTETLFSTSSFSPSFAPTEIPSSQLPTGNPIRFHFINVGQGDATLIQTPNGLNMLIDGGDTNTGIVQYLISMGVHRIDLMVATHPHSDHIGGLVQVLQAFPVTKVVTNGEPYTTSVYEHFLDAIMAAKADYIELKRGDVLSLDGIDFNCLSPITPNNPDPNENSIVLQFNYGKTTFLLMGDAGAETESALLAANFLSKVNILKVGHHGSATASSPAFLNVIKPDVAIYSAGINNIYGLPSPQTIAALVVSGAKVYGTDQNGTIIITTNLNGYTISTAKGNTNITPTLTPTEILTQAFTLTQTPTLAITLTPSLSLTPTWTSTITGPGQLEIVSVTSPVPRNSYATLVAQASPNASCSIVVQYKSGPSHANGLGPKNADASGLVSWTWTVGRNTTPGNWPIYVTCNGTTKSTTFTVQ